jgi:heme/copper-type cytochrome/quinol oxidase subunit 2
MRGVIIVETQEEYNAWLGDKKPQYVTVKEAAPAATPAAAADSATAKPIAQLTK